MSVIALNAFPDPAVRAPLLAFSVLMVPPSMLLTAYMIIRSRKAARNHKNEDAIVGGVAGGASCAARLRRLDEKAEILMVERGPYVSYANCRLPTISGA